MSAFAHRGRAQFVTGARGTTHSVAEPPALRVGERRCPTCRNRTQLTMRGYLRRHKDLFGHNCYNVALDPQ